MTRTRISKQTSKRTSVILFGTLIACLLISQVGHDTQGQEAVGGESLESSTSGKNGVAERQVEQESTEQGSPDKERDWIAESNIRRQMDLLYEPAYLTLREQIGSANEGEDVDWRTVARQSLLLSELLARLDALPHQSNLDEAAQRAAIEANEENKVYETFQHARKIYLAAADKELTVARAEFEAMINSCNVCHSRNASGWSPKQLKH